MAKKIAKKKSVKSRVKIIPGKDIIPINPQENYFNKSKSHNDKKPRFKVGSWGSNENTGIANYTVPDSYSEFSEFPAITYFLNSYGFFPSNAYFSYAFKKDEFEKQIENIKKDFYYEKVTFHCDTLNPFVDRNNDKSYICFHSKKYKVFFYINIYDSYFSDESAKEEFKKLNGKNYAISVLYNPNQYTSKKVSELFNILFPIKKIFIKSDKSTINFISQNQQGFHTIPTEIKKPQIDFDVNYSNEFSKKHEFLVSELSKDKSGIVFLYGISGGGKTMYLRYLINELKDKKVLYMPSNMVQMLSSPEFLSFMISQKNSILVIEDAENCIKNNGDRDIAVTNLLNLADGMMSDALNIKIIATFNTEIRNIDQALLREGRMILKHEFKALPAEQATALSKKLGINKVYETERTLAQVYNEEKEFKEETVSKKPVGFKS
jgi:hypothetical protein